MKEGVIPIEEANDIFICVGVFIHWDAEDKAKIQDWNYEATKLAIKRAVEGSPSPAEVIAQELSIGRAYLQGLSFKVKWSDQKNKPGWMELVEPNPTKSAVSA